MKRTIGLLVGAAALGLLSTQCGDDGGDGTPAPPSGGAPPGGAPAGGASAGVAGAAAGSPTVGGGGASAGTGAGGASAGTAGSLAGAGTGGASAGSGGASGGSGGASGGSGGALAGSGGASGGSGGASGGSGGGSGGSAAGSGGSGNVGTFAQVSQILTSKCAIAGCHAKGNGFHVELHADGLYNRLTSAPISGNGAECKGSMLVVKGNSSGSILSSVVHGPTSCGGGSGNDIDQMPYQCKSGGGGMRPCLSDMEKATIKSWIDAGALE